MPEPTLIIDLITSIDREALKALAATLCAMSIASIAGTCLGGLR